MEDFVYVVKSHKDTDVMDATSFATFDEAMNFLTDLNDPDLYIVQVAIARDEFGYSTAVGHEEVVFDPKAELAAVEEAAAKAAEEECMFSSADLKNYDDETKSWS